MLAKSPGGHQLEQATTAIMLIDALLAALDDAELIHDLESARLPLARVQGKLLDRWLSDDSLPPQARHLGE